MSHSDLTMRSTEQRDEEKKEAEAEAEEEINMRVEDKNKTELERDTKAERHGMFLFSVNSSVVPYNFSQ